MITKNSSLYSILFYFFAFIYIHHYLALYKMKEPD